MERSGIVERALYLALQASLVLSGAALAVREAERSRWFFALLLSVVSILTARQAIQYVREDRLRPSEVGLGLFVAVAAVLTLEFLL